MKAAGLDDSSLKELKALPRYSRGRVNLAGLIIDYNDPLALYNEFLDIFVNKVYDFQPRRDRPLILDVGGYIGLSAMRFLQTLPHAEIVVFEPDPDVYKLLETNIEQNGFRNARLINAGVAKEEGRVTFFPDGADGGNTSFRRQDRTEQIEVNMVKLSGFIEGQVDLLKMNIEGMEGEVFEEIEQRLPLIDEIVFEYHAFYNLPQRLGSILELLNRNGFRYLIADVPCAATQLPFRMTGTYRNFNLVYAGNPRLLRKEP